MAFSGVVSKFTSPSPNVPRPSNKWANALSYSPAYLVNVLPTASSVVSAIDFKLLNIDFQLLTSAVPTFLTEFVNELNAFVLLIASNAVVNAFLIFSAISSAFDLPVSQSPQMSDQSIPEMSPIPPAPPPAPPPEPPLDCGSFRTFISSKLASVFFNALAALFAPPSAPVASFALSASAPALTLAD